MTGGLGALRFLLKRKESPYLRFVLRAFREADPCFGEADPCFGGEEDPAAAERFMSREWLIRRTR